MKYSSTNSIWYKDSKQQEYPSLHQDLEADVVIVGGGIAGMTTAYILKKSGYKVAVLEKHNFSSGTTCGTTGKVTTQHGLIYADLVHRFGRIKAQTYAHAYMSAMKRIESVISDERINCDWEKSDNYVYTVSSKKISKLKQEAEVVASLGLPASFEETSELPFDIKGAVKFKNQAKFNAVKYVAGLAQLINKDGSYVFEDSQVKSFKNGKYRGVTTKFGSVRAKHIVVATKIPPYPLIARFSYALLEYPQTSYIVAGPAKKLNGMYISVDKNQYSLMSTGNSLLVGGEGHIPGIGRPSKKFNKLATYGKTHFNLQPGDYEWKAMDYIAYDKLPAIGKLYPWSKNIYVLTGFKKWGLTTSMVGAQIIKDLINNKETPTTKLFYPHRLSAPLAIPKAIKEYFTS